MAERQPGNFKGKQQMSSSYNPAKMADAAKETMMRLYKKLKQEVILKKNLETLSVQ